MIPNKYSDFIQTESRYEETTIHSMEAKNGSEILPYIHLKANYNVPTRQETLRLFAATQYLHFFSYFLDSYYGAIIIKVSVLFKSQALFHMKEFT